MQIFTLLKSEFPKTSYPLIGYSILAGASNAALIGIINSAAESVSSSSINWKYTILYTLCLGIVFMTKRYVLDSSSELVETVVNRLRHRLADKVRHTELSTLEKRGTATIYARISEDATIISNVATTVINGTQDAVMIVFTLIYVLFISFWSFALIAIGLVVGITYYISTSEEFRGMWVEVSKKQTEFFEKLSHILQGFKEININRLKNEKVFNNYVTVNNNLRRQRIKTSKAYNSQIIFSEIFFYILLGVILFVMPKIHPEHSEVMIKVVAAVLFIIGPLEGLLFSIPSLANANNSAVNIMLLEKQLEEELNNLGKERLNPHSAEAYEAFSLKDNFRLKQLTYQYPDTQFGAGFQVGPIDLKVNKGELIFITGGNGSGKSTFLKLLTGLYMPTRGSLVIDETEEKRGISITNQNYQQYKNMITTIFSDYHLFDKLYGIKGEVDAEIVNIVLGMVDLPPEKVTFKDGTFTSIRLSSGQKKRLALTTAILEDKDIYIFDEVAADLDPSFRDKFYFELLPALKKRNKTILAVSHDQQYWLVPDRMLHFQDGEMKELTRSEMKSLVEMAVK